MLYVGTNRWDFLRFLPKGGCVAEIGVFKGAFSEAVLRTMRPSKYHLIDPWIVHEDSEYTADPANSNQPTHNAHYEEVITKFSKEIESGVVQIHRSKSSDCVNSFPDKYFDFIYVDAMHYHAAVLSDLMMFVPKLKLGGIIGGHDYVEHDLSAKMNFGVITAVSTFVKRSSFRIAFITGPEQGLPFPSYFLCNESNAKWEEDCMFSLIEEKVLVVQIPDAVAANFSHKKIVKQGKQPLYVPSFG